MPQGSWLGPLSFLVHIDDLNVDCLIHKYVDDTTLTELLCSSKNVSNLHNFLDQLLQWSSANDMVVNSTKTKEIVMAPQALTSNLQPLRVDTSSIERVSSAKLLGLHINSDLTWSTHIEAIVSKATQRLYFLKHPRRAGVPNVQLLHFYLTVIRPLLEYVCPVRFGITP